MPVGSGSGVNSVWMKVHFVLSPVSLVSRDQAGGPSNSTIDIYDLTKK